MKLSSTFEQCSGDSGGIFRRWDNLKENFFIGWNFDEVEMLADFPQSLRWKRLEKFDPLHRFWNKKRSVRKKEEKIFKGVGICIYKVVETFFKKKEKKSTSAD